MITSFHHQLDMASSGVWENILLCKTPTLDGVCRIYIFSESITNTCKRYGIQVYFKGGKTIKDLLVAPKDKEHITKKSGIIYRYTCDRLECNEVYIGELAWTFGERFRENLKAPSPIYDHSNITGHTTTLENFSVMGREDQNLTRLITESMYIRINNPSLNRKYRQIPSVTHMEWGSVKEHRTQTKIKWPCGYSICHKGNNVCHLTMWLFHLPQ